MGTVAVHEFMTLDGVIDAPTWTFDYPLDPKMGEAIAALMGGCNAILLGRTTYEMFEPAWSARTAEDDPGAPFMNGTPKYVVSSTLTHADWNNSRFGDLPPIPLAGLPSARVGGLRRGLTGQASSIVPR
jgi:dihydrofolate reductase